MKRTLFSALTVTLLSFAAAAPSFARTADYTSNTYDFQQTLAPWAAAAEYSENLGKEALQLRFEQDPIAGTAMANGFAALTRENGPALWMQARLQSAGSRIRLEFDAKSIENCEGCIPLVYLGENAPTTLAQFTTDFAGLGESWGRHKFELQAEGRLDSGKSIDIPGPGNMIVAIAFTSLEGGPDQPGMRMVQGIGVDNISVTMEDTILPLND
jgi:hypothetical protein